MNGNTGHRLPIVCRLHNRKWWLLRSRRRLLWFQDTEMLATGSETLLAAGWGHLSMFLFLTDVETLDWLDPVIWVWHQFTIGFYFPFGRKWCLEKLVFIYICISLWWKYRPSTHIIIVGLRSCVCSAALIQLYTLFFCILFHHGLCQDIKYSPQRYTVAPCCLSVLYVLVCIC